MIFEKWGERWTVGRLDGFDEKYFSIFVYVIFFFFREGGRGRMKKEREVQTGCPVLSSLKIYRLIVKRVCRQWVGLPEDRGRVKGLLRRLLVLLVRSQCR